MQGERSGDVEARQASTATGRFAEDGEEPHSRTHVCSLAKTPLLVVTGK
jgi:hypothetical protein